MCLVAEIRRGGAGQVQSRTEKEAVVANQLIEVQVFEKVKDVKPGETRKVSLKLSERSFSYWSVEDVEWKIDAGHYDIMVGASSRDIRLKTHVDIE